MKKAIFNIASSVCFMTAGALLDTGKVGLAVALFLCILGDFLMDLYAKQYNK